MNARNKYYKNTTSKFRLLIFLMLSGPESFTTTSYFFTDSKTHLWK